MNLRTTFFVACAVMGLSRAALAEPATTNQWEHTLSLGVTETSGNTEMRMGTASWLSEFRSLGGDLVRLSADGQNGKEKGQKTADNVKGDANYKCAFDGSLYAVADVAGLYDSVADISYRITPSVGLGCFILKDSANSFSVDIGPAYVFEKVGGVKDDYAAFRASERFERKLGAKAKCWEAVEYIPKVSDFDVYNIAGEIGAEAPLTSSINLRLVFADRYQNIPAPDHKRNDTQIVGAVAIKI